MTKIIEAMYDLANEEDRFGDNAPEKRVGLIMQRFNKEKDGETFHSITFFFSTDVDFSSFNLDIVDRQEFIDGCLRDELLRKILAPNTTMLSDDSPVDDLSLKD